MAFESSISLLAFCLLSRLGLSGSTCVDGDTRLGGSTNSLWEYFVKVGSFKYIFFVGVKGPSPLSSCSNGETDSLFASFILVVVG